MVEKLITSPGNVRRFPRANRTGKAVAISARVCRHCGAALSDGEREDECSSAFNVDVESLRWQAAQILRGLL